MVSMMKGFCTEVLSNQGERSMNFYFIMVPLRKQVLKYGTPKPSIRVREALHKGFAAGLFCLRGRAISAYGGSSRSD